MSLISKVVSYYGARAHEYDITVRYGHPDAPTGFDHIKREYSKTLRGLDVLEVACGTGFWTQSIATSARSILATDRDPELVSIVRNKLATLNNVRCQVADAYSLEGVQGHFTAGCAQMWWSHIPRAKVRSFLKALHSKLIPGSAVMCMDDLAYTHTGARRFDACGDLLEERRLQDGTQFEILKNFPTEWEITTALSGIAKDIEYWTVPECQCWVVRYRTA
jgi:SAM-dependent methyltransferase